MANDVAKPQDQDPEETREWLDALKSVLEVEGVGRAHYLIEQLIDTARRSGAHLPLPCAVPAGAVSCPSRRAS